MKTFKKRVTALLMASVLLLTLIFSLTACGDNSEPTASGAQNGKAEDPVATEVQEKETKDTQYCDQAHCNLMFPHIHISMDNWEEYFEFKIEYQFGNGTENMDKYIITKTVFNVREEWMEKISDVDLHYQVGYTEYSVPGEIDWDDRTVTVDEDAEKVYSSHIDDQWYDTGYSFDEETGLTERTHMASITNDREDYDGTIRIWEPEMLSISEGGHITLK